MTCTARGCRCGQPVVIRSPGAWCWRQVIHQLADVNRVTGFAARPATDGAARGEERGFAPFLSASLLFFNPWSRVQGQLFSFFSTSHESPRFPMNGRTHRKIGAAAGAVTSFSRSSSTDEFGTRIIEAIGGALAGRLGARMPDWIEPAIHSHHRSTFHSVAAGTALNKKATSIAGS